MMVLFETSSTHGNIAPSNPNKCSADLCANVAMFLEECTLDDPRSAYVSRGGQTKRCSYVRSLGYYVMHSFSDFTSEFTPHDIILSVNITSSTVISLRILLPFW